MIGIGHNTLFYTKEQVMEFVFTLYKRSLTVSSRQRIDMPLYFDIRQHYELGRISVAYFKRHVGYIDMWSERITYVM
jgi:hypothetical protein